MKKRRQLYIACALFLGASVWLYGCGESSGGSTSAQAAASGTSTTSAQTQSQTAEAAESHRDTLTDFPVPEASGSVVYTAEGCEIDASNTAEGYVMVKYTGSADKVKVQITAPNGSDVYTYTLAIGDYETFPLSAGDGNYQICILEHADDDFYGMLLSQEFSVSLNDEFRPFLYPNQYVWYTASDEAIKLGIQLSDQSADDLAYLTNVYHYVTQNITYDTEKAANIQANYLPDIDDTLATGKGICFDYASLMSAMLRSQGIPTKLVIGYSGTAYHAWISVWMEETGWVDKIIQFDGTEWSLMDPTLAASNKESFVAQYIGDGTNYTVKYNY